MKRFFVGTLSFLLVYTAAATGSACAETLTSTAPSQMTSTTVTVVRNFTPFELVSAAYRGSFREQGIPGYGRLISDFYLGKVNAESLVKAGIAAGKVSSDTLNNQSYLSTVAYQLQTLHQG
ncbi:MAG: hypothetical protein SAK29_24605 [Scytonema sp. PMC 1069.18]|nr:hypothetical protein [Scytonema sp. PMC 1069.18]MEC4882748.1 hypothetical protein [Scytonema sp. PMC 1070.18]